MSGNPSGLAARRVGSPPDSVTSAHALLDERAHQLARLPCGPSRHRSGCDPGFNEIGLACLDPQQAGGHPRLLSPDNEDFVIQTATIRPTKLGLPFTRWSIRKLAAYLRKVHGRLSRRLIRIGREANHAWTEKPGEPSRSQH